MKNLEPPALSPWRAKTYGLCCITSCKTMVTEGNNSLRGDLKENLPSVSPNMDQLAPMLKGLSSEERDQIIQVMQRDQVFHSSSSDSICSSMSIPVYSASISAHSSLLSDNFSTILAENEQKEIIPIFQEENHSSPKAINNQSLDEGILTPIESEDKTSTLADNLAQIAHNNDSFESISLSSAKVPEAKESWSRRTSVISNISESNTSFRGAFALNNLGVMTPDLSVLGPEEQEKILEVIRKDTVLQLYIDLKVSRLKAELAMLRKKGALKVNQNHPVWHVDPNRSCGRCRAELGRIMNRGAFCKACKVRVCKNCREYNLKGTDWICTVCHKNLEIQVASGEWIKEHMSHSGVIQVKKKTSRHYVPTTPVDLIKSNKNIKRSWTISNPSGTGGPQIQTRSQSDPRNPFSDDPRLPPPKIAPPLFLNIPPPPTTSPPPIPTNQRYAPAFQPPGVMPRRNIPLRSQSMSTADHSTRFYPHRRPPMERAELADTDTDLMDPRKYRTLEGMVGRGRGVHAIITHPENGGYNTNSLERGMRRRLPDIPPSRSLPRPAKRGQSDSRSRDRNGDQKRSQSFGNELDESRRGNHYLSDGPHVKDSSKNKEGRVVREPTPDYDGSSITGDPVLSGKQNPHLGITSLPDTERSHGGVSGGTQSSAPPSSQFPAHPHGKSQDKSVTANSKKTHPKDPAVSSVSGSKVSVPVSPEQVGEIITTTKKTTSKTKSVTTTTAKFAHLQSDPTLPEEVSAEEDHHHHHHHHHRNAGSTSTDLSHKLVPDGNDFKLVFISSDSSKESELNSSLEGGISSDQEKQKRSLGEIKHSGGEFIDDEMEWSLGYRPPIKAKPDFIASSSPKLKKFTKRTGRGDSSPPALPPKSKVYHNPHGLGSASLLDDYHFISSSSGGGSVVMSDGEKLPMALSSSPSVVHSIRTSATRDRTSPIRQSPRIPKVHNIPILREDPLQTIHQIKRSRSAHSIIEATESETSQDYEVQAILRKHPKLVVPNVSQKVNKGANLTKPKRTTKTIVGSGGDANSGVGDLHNTSAEVEHYMSAKGFASITANPDDLQQMLEMAKSVSANGQHHHYQTGNMNTAGSSIRSFEDRSLDEMSIHDQLVLLSELEGEVDEDPKIEHFRSYLLAEIKAYNESHKGSGGLLSRSLSESDLSELCGASVQAPSPDELLRSFSPSSEQTVLKPSANARDETSSTSTGDTTYEKEKSSSRRSARMTQGSRPDDVPRAEGPPPMLPPKNHRRLHPASDGGPSGDGGVRVPSSGHLGPQALTLMKGNAGIRAPSGSVSSSRTSGGSSSASTSSNSSGCTVNNKFQLPETFVDIDQWQTQNNHGNGEHRSDKTSREFKSEYRLSLNPGSENQGGVYRSASSITSRPKGKAPLVKPVRRSKSHKATSVTNILHGGPVTFVSVNNINHLVELTTPENPCPEDIFQGSHTLPRASGSRQSTKSKAKNGCSDDSDVIITNTTHMESGGKGVRIQIGSGGSSQGGTKAGISSVLSSSTSSHPSLPHGRFPQQNSDKKRVSKVASATLTANSGVFEEKPDNVDKNRIEQECQTSIDFRYSEYDTLASNGVSNNPLTSSARVSRPSKVIASTSSKNKKGRRKYTLEELEVEGFEPSSCSESEKLHISDADLDEDDIDLSSLIEGAVDDDDDDDDDGEGEGEGEEDEEQEAYDVVTSSANNEAMSDPRLHFKPVQASAKMQGNSDSNPLGEHHQTRIQRVDDAVSSEDEDLLSMAVHQGSLSSHNFVALQPHSDTEADFLESSKVHSSQKRGSSSTSSTSAANSSAKSRNGGRPLPPPQPARRRMLPKEPTMNTVTAINNAEKHALSSREEVEKSQLLNLLPTTDNSSRVLSSGNVSIAAETSDFDSISTTSASYVVNHSDVDSILNEEFSTNLANVNEGETKGVIERQLLPDRFPPHMSIDAPASPSPFSPEKQQGQQILSPVAQPSLTSSTINDGQEHRATNTVAKAKSALGLPVSRPKKKEGDELPQGTKLAPSSPTQAGRTSLGNEVGPENLAEEDEREEEEDRSASDLTAVTCEEIRSEQGPPVKSSRKRKTLEIEPEAHSSDNRPTEAQVTASDNDFDDLVEDTRPGECNNPQQELKQRKGSVSDLIARFETSNSKKTSSSSSVSNVDSLRSTRSVTPERNSRSITPDQRPSSASGQFTRSKSATPSLCGLAEESENKSEASPSERALIGSPIPETDEITIENELEPEPEKEKPKEESDEALETLPLGAEALTLEQKPTEGESDPPEESLDLEELDEEMAKTLRNRNGGYTSYVFISSDPTQDDAASVVSVGSNKSVGDNRVRVNIKETGANCVVLQDGRASNISIVSTESSELGSPTSPINGNDEDELFMQRAPPQQVPDLPAKIRSRNGGVIDLAQHFSPPPSLEYRARTRGGEVSEPFEDEYLNRNEDTPSPVGDEAQNDRNGLANYFTNALEAGGHTSSRRGRPPVIRAADRAARSRQHQMAPDQYDEGDHDGMEGAVDGDGHDYMYDEDHEFQISEMHDSSHPYDEEDVLYSDEYDPNYEVRYESGEEDEYGETAREYPMCQPVYDDSGDEYSEGEPLSSGDEYFDREEELRGYNRQIDFTLHTILEESCEDSEYESRSLEQQQQQKRQSDPSALERYFFYDVGGGNEDDTFSETSLNTTSERTHEEEELSIAAEESASNRYDKYFTPLGSVQNNPIESLEMISDVQTDDGGSVGSESDGQRSPNGFNKKKKVIRSKGFRTERLSDRGESDNGNSNVEDDPLHRPLEASYSNSSDDSHAQISGETQFDTMKRKKKQSRRTGAEDRKSDGERSADSRRPSGASVEQLGVINPLFKAPINVEESLKKDGISPKGTPPITPLPSQIIEVQPASTASGSSLEPGLQQSASPSGSEKEFDLMKQSKKSKAALLLQRESHHASPTGSPPVNGPVRKHKSRDSGFVGSTDDLLRNETNQVGVTSSDSNHSLSDHENERKNSQPRLEKLSEVSENTEDDAENHQQHLVDIAFGKGDIKTEQIVNFQLPRKESPDAIRGPLTHSQLVRKDSFQNWSSDEDTNIMMNRMRSFFKGILAGHHGVTPESKEKPPQILAFEEQLTKLMRTVPGINEDQVKEIVEYLSSEDTWSDSYDSSDYASSDLDGAYGYIDADIPDLNISPEIQQQISSSCQEIIQKFDTGSYGTTQPANLSVDQDEFQKEAALMYQQLMAKMQQNQMEKELHRQASRSTRNSPPIAAKVMQHISTRLVALMHEAGVNNEGGNSSSASMTEATSSSTFSDRRQIGPPTRRYKRVQDDKKGEDFMNPKISTHLNKSSSKSVEALTANSSRKSSNDYDVWQGVARDGNQNQGQPRRGSLGMVKGQMESLQSHSSGSINEDERCSWKGSFESTLAADMSSKHRRVGSNSELNSSSMEQIDKSRSGSKSARGTRNSARVSVPVVHTDSEEESARQSSHNDPSSSSTLPRENSLHSSSSSSVRSSVSSRHSTNSLPRLGTSAIKKPRAPQAPTTTATGPSQIMTTTVTLAAALSAGPNGGGSGPRSARYRPPGYKPAPSRKISPSMGNVLPQRKTSIEGVYVQRFNDDVASEFSSKSGSPSPVIMRDFRESSVNSKSSLETNEEEHPRDERYPSPFNKAGSLSSLGSRSESMLSVYSQEGGRYGSVVVRGEVELGMLYSFSSGCLEMAIKQCRDLAAVDTKRNRSDPYVKVYLLPDKTKSGKRKTKVKKHTLNPVFDEILKFQMPLSEVEKRTIWLTVWHSDMFGRNDFLGEVMLPMAGQVYDEPSPKWYSLQDRTEPPGGEDDPMGAYRGEIIIALKFVPNTSDLKSKSSRQVRKTRGMLMVLVKEAKNLVPLKGSANTDPFCKCYLLPERNKTGKQKTNVCRRTSNPRWEHTVTWDQVTMADLADRSLEVSVWDHDRLGQNDMLGGVRFNLGSGKHQSKPSAWMDSTGKEVTLWQQMLDRPNFWVEGAVHLRPVEKMNSTPSPI